MCVGAAQGALEYAIALHERAHGRRPAARRRSRVCSGRSPTWPRSSKARGCSSSARCASPVRTARRPRSRPRWRRPRRTSRRSSSATRRSSSSAATATPASTPSSASYRDIRGLCIGAGTVEIQRNFIGTNLLQGRVPSGNAWRHAARSDVAGLRADLPPPAAPASTADPVARGTSRRSTRSLGAHDDAATTPAAMRPASPGGLRGRGVRQRRRRRLAAPELATRPCCCTGPAGASARSPGRSTTRPARPRSTAMRGALDPDGASSPPTMRVTCPTGDAGAPTGARARPGRPRGRAVHRRLDRRAQGGAAHPPRPRAQGADDGRASHGLHRPTTRCSCPRRSPTSPGCSTACSSPARPGMRTVLMARWDPERALDARSSASGSRFMIGPPTFFVQLMAAPGFSARARRVAAPRLVAAAPASRRRSSPRRRERLGARVKRTYGSTEAPTVTSSTRARLRPTAPPRPTGARSAQCELRIAADGELLLRGPELFAGYADAEQTRAAVDARVVPHRRPRHGRRRRLAHDRRAQEGRDHPRRREHRRRPRSRTRSSRTRRSGKRWRSGIPTSGSASGCARSS